MSMLQSSPKREATMAAKPIGTKLTPEQIDILAAQFPDLSNSDVLRLALAALAEKHGYEWEDVEMRHGDPDRWGGKRPKRERKHTP